MCAALSTQDAHRVRADVCACTMLIAPARAGTQRGDAHHVRSLPRAPTMAIIDVLESATLTPSPRLLAPPSSSVRGNTRHP